MSHPEVLTQALLRFVSRGRTFAVDVARVQDVVERPYIAAFPDSRPGMLGIANIRGQIIPVRASEGSSVQRDQAASRLLVIEFEPGRPFGILVDRIQKVSTEASTLRPNQEFSLDGVPVRYLHDENGLN